MFRYVIIVALCWVVLSPALTQAQAVFTDDFESWDLSHWSETSLPVWLEYMDRFRAQAGARWPTENTDWSYGCEMHARYCVKNDYIGHSEDSSNVWYTPEGAAAAQNGNVAVSSSSTAPDLGFIDMWMTGPFHAVGIIDPQLAESGFGTYHEADGGWQSAATLDVLRGLGSVPAGTSFPLYFPGDGGRTWLLSYGGSEAPDPLTSCPGYSAPTGPPLILQLGSGGVTPSVTATSLVRDSATPLDHCVFDETDYVNGNSTYQLLGRNVLNSRDAVVIMPKAPLTAGHSYTVSITSGGTVYSWSFTTTSPAKSGLVEEEPWSYVDGGTPPQPDTETHSD